MDRNQFIAEVQREGYAVREADIPPNQHRPPHTHDFDVRLFILDGTLTLGFDDGRQSYVTGDTCAVPAGMRHDENTGADGVRYLAGRRSPA